MICGLYGCHLPSKAPVCPAHMLRRRDYGSFGIPNPIWPYFNYGCRALFCEEEPLEFQPFCATHAAAHSIGFTPITGKLVRRQGPTCERCGAPSARPGVLEADKLCDDCKAWWKECRIPAMPYVPQVKNEPVSIARPDNPRDFVMDVLVHEPREDECVPWPWVGTSRRGPIWTEVDDDGIRRRIYVWRFMLRLKNFPRPTHRHVVMCGTDNCLNLGHLLPDDDETLQPFLSKLSSRGVTNAELVAMSEAFPTAEQVEHAHSVVDARFGPVG